MERDACMHDGCVVYIYIYTRDLGVLGVEMVGVLGVGRGGGAGDEVAVDERPVALKTVLLDEDKDDASDPGRLCTYIGADSFAPVCGRNRC